MRINGLRMDNYWIVNFVFNFALYSVVCLAFILTGTYVFGIMFFTTSSPFLMFITFVGWGLA